MKRGKLRLEFSPSCVLNVFRTKDGKMVKIVCKMLTKYSDEPLVMVRKLRIPAGVDNAFRRYLLLKNVDEIKQEYEAIGNG